VYSVVATHIDEPADVLQGLLRVLPDAVPARLGRPRIDMVDELDEGVDGVLQRRKRVAQGGECRLGGLLAGRSTQVRHGRRGACECGVEVGGEGVGARDKRQQRRGAGHAEDTSGRSGGGGRGREGSEAVWWREQHGAARATP
jgi:hypothetical protein